MSVRPSTLFVWSWWNLVCVYRITKSAVRCVRTISDYFPVNTAVRQGCVLTPLLFNTCMSYVLGRMSGKSGCGVSYGTVTDLDFAVILAEATDVLAGALDSLSEEAEPLVLSSLVEDQGPGVQLHPGCDRWVASRNSCERSCRCMRM